MKHRTYWSLATLYELVCSKYNAAVFTFKTRGFIKIGKLYIHICEAERSRIS